MEGLMHSTVQDSLCGICPADGQACKSWPCVMLTGASCLWA